MFILRPCLQFNSGNWSSMRSFLYFYLNRRCCKLGADWKSQGPDWRWRRQDLTDCQFQEFKFQFITKSGYSKSRYDSIFHPHHSTPVSRKYGMIMQYLYIFFFIKPESEKAWGGKNNMNLYYSNVDVLLSSWVSLMKYCIPGICSMNKFHLKLNWLKFVRL